MWQNSHAKQMSEILENESYLGEVAPIFVLCRVYVKPGWEEAEDTNRPSQRDLAKKLDRLSEEEPIFDLLVIDEAHHLRNKTTQLFKIGDMLRSISNYAIFLSILDSFMTKICPN